VFKTDEQLGEIVGDALQAIDLYPDPRTKAELLLPAIPAAKMLARRMRCCRGHRILAWLNVAQLICMRQFFLRVSWRQEGLGAGTTIRLWAWVGMHVTKATIFVRGVMAQMHRRSGRPFCTGTCGHRPHVENT
jgi:hypothetical protein